MAVRVRVYAWRAQVQCSARYLRDGRVRGAARGLRRPVTSGTPLMSWGGKQRGWGRIERARARAGERGGTGGRRPPHVAAQVSINRCAASARARRGRGTFMSREQLTAEPRKHESGPSPDPAARPPPRAPLSWPTLRRALPNANAYTKHRSAKYGETFQWTCFIIQVLN